MASTVINALEMQTVNSVQISSDKNNFLTLYSINHVWTDVFVTGLQQSLAFKNYVVLFGDISLVEL